MSPDARVALGHRRLGSARIASALLIAGAVAWAPSPPARAAVEVVHAFEKSGEQPNRLTPGADGALYGTTYRGGVHGLGTIFRLDPDGSLETLHSFTGPDGAYPDAPLTLASDGTLFGTTLLGGADWKGTVFKLDTSRVFSSIYSFTAALDHLPTGALTIGADGALYGAMYRSAYQQPPGTFVYSEGLFRVSVSGAFTSILSNVPSTSSGTERATGPTLRSDGALYGVTAANGSTGSGMVYRVSPSGVLSWIHDFSGSDGSAPSALALAGDGALYGTTSSGGAYGRGTLFRITSTGTFESLRSFDGLDGAAPQLLTLGSDGALYGSSESGGVLGRGTLFKLDTDGAFTPLHEFDGSDGWVPKGTLTQGSDGALYGLTFAGGAYGDGTLFKINSTGGFSSLRDFEDAADGAEGTPLVLGGDGLLYGASIGTGSLLHDGLLYRIDTGGLYTVMHRFQSPGGLNPTSLLLGIDGALYGTTQFGGEFGGGTLFRIDSNGDFSSLHSFEASSDGYPPVGRLVRAGDGALYGTTRGAGPSGWGALFKLDASGAFSILHGFNGLDARGETAYLSPHSSGAIYGSSTTGGAAPYRGTLFRVDAAGVFTLLHSFSLANGVGPRALTEGSDAALYGGTSSGGVYGLGTLFRIDAAGLFSSLHSFSGSDGQSPVAGFARAADGALYGSTTHGGSFAGGTLFRIDASGAFASVHSFAPGEAFRPAIPLTLGTNAALYGVSEEGGSAGGGALYRRDPDGTVSSLHSFNPFPGDGAHPLAALTEGADGALYGTTASGDGDAFKVGKRGDFVHLHSFDRRVDGDGPLDVPLSAHGGMMYGILYGSSISGGAVYRFPIGAPQSIGFAPLPPRSCGDPPFQVSATATSGLPVGLAASGTCTVAVDVVTLSGPGSCTITAYQVGNADFAAAPDVEQSFPIGVDASCDVDEDGVADEDDNCPGDANPTQADLDGNGVGDACDPDVDGDASANGGDNCPFTANPDQRDSGGVASYEADGIGDACQCGDVNDDGVIDLTDVAAYRQGLADPTGNPLSPAGVSKCAVIGSDGACQITSVAVILRAFEDPPLGPPLAQVCAAVAPN